LVALGEDQLYCEQLVLAVPRVASDDNKDLIRSLLTLGFSQVTPEVVTVKDNYLFGLEL
jgi:hypothetical protein